MIAERRTPLMEKEGEDRLTRAERASRPLVLRNLKEVVGAAKFVGLLLRIARIQNPLPIDHQLVAVDA